MNGKINNITAMFMIFTALLFDLMIGLFSLFHVIPFVGTVIATSFTFIISLFALLTLGFWFLLKGVKILSPKRAITMSAGFVIGVIPIVNILPNWTLATVITILTTKTKLIKAK